MGRAPVVTTPIDADPIVLEFVRRQRETASTFDRWLRADSPALNWDYKHIIAIREALDRVTSGETTRLIITLPSQHGKSSLVTVRYPVWRIIRDPRLPVIVGSYNEEKAAEFATKARKIAARWVSFSKDVNRVDEWQTTAGGGLVSVGTTSGTGRPAKLFVLDDLFKNAADAESFARREAVWRWYTQVVMTRRPEAIIVVATRWSEDDLTGRLLADKEANPAWEHVHLKALATEGDPLGRAVGEALCPEMQSRESLLEWQRIDPFAFMTMGQGEVAPREGSLFEVAKMPVVPAAEVPSGLPMVRAWDLAASSSEKSDETAGVLMSGPGPGGIYYVLDVVHGHWEPSERNRQILQTARTDGVDVPIWSPQDPGPHGKEAAERIMELLDGFRAATHSVLTRQGARPDSKKMRAEPWRSRVNEGKVRVVDGPWTKYYIEQHRRFTGGHGKDDMVDASALAYAALRTERTPGDYGIG